MRNKIIRFSLFILFVFIMTILFSYKYVGEEIYENVFSNRRNILASRAGVINENIDNSTLVEFKLNNNLNKVYFVENNTITASSDLRTGMAANLKEVNSNVGNFVKSGFWFKNNEKIEFYFPIQKKGILVMEFSSIFEDQLTSKLLRYFMIILLISGGFIYIASLVYNLYNYMNPLEKVKKYLTSFVNHASPSSYERKIVTEAKGDSKEMIVALNGFLDEVKEKITLIDNDRVAMKKIYEAMKLKNSKVLSLYEFAKTLSFDIELEKIYEKIQGIMFQFMSANAMAILLKNDMDVLELEYIKGVTNYENGKKENKIEDVVMKFSKPIKVRDAFADKRVEFMNMTNKDKNMFASFVIVPLKADNEVFGVMIVDSIFNGKLKHAEEITTLATTGEIAARAIKKALKYRQMNIGLNMASLLYRITTLVESNQNLYEIFKEIINSIKRVVDYSSAAIYLIKDNNDLEDVPQYREGEKNELLENVEFRLGKGIKALVAQNKDTVIIKDLRRNQKNLREIFNESETSIASFASVPMLVEDRLVGVINLTHKEPNKFREEDKQLLRVFANQAAATIEKIKKDRKIEELLAKVTNEAITDPLTKVYNRRYMMKRLKEELERAKRENQNMGLIAVDIDFFKKVNDNYGHQAGDAVLSQTAAVIKDSVRVIDIPCRYGGEEFFIILPNTTKEGLYVTAERIRTGIESTPMKISGGALNITVSVGGGVFPENGLDDVEIIRAADTALYTAKESGRNRVILYGN